MAKLALLGLLLVALLMALPGPMVVELEPGEVGPAEWGVYLQTSDGLYKAAVVYLPAYYEVAFLDNTTGKAPFYQPWRFAVLPLEKVNSTGRVVGRIATNKGVVLFVDEPPVIIFAREAPEAEPAEVIAKELPPPRGLAPMPNITTRPEDQATRPEDQAARPERADRGAEEPGGREAEPASVGVGTALEPVGALYLAGQAGSGQYLRAYIADPSTQLLCGSDTYVYMGKDVRHAALGIYSRNGARGRVVVELYEVKDFQTCQLLYVSSIPVSLGSGQFQFAYFIVRYKPLGSNIDVRGRYLAARFRFEGSGAVSANVSIAYDRRVEAGFQTSTYDLRQYSRIYSSQYFYGALHSPHIPPDGISNMNLNIGATLYTADVSNGVCQYSQLRYEVYINSFYEGGGYLQCRTEGGSCRCGGTIALSYSSPPFPLRYAKGAGKGAVAVALIFKRPDSSTPPRIYRYEASQHISGNFWREIYPPDSFTWRFLQQFFHVHIINREATHVVVVGRSMGTSSGGSWRLGLELGVAGPAISRVDRIEVKFRHNMVGRLSNLPYVLYYATGNAIRPVTAPWWQELAASAIRFILLITLLVTTLIPMGYSQSALAGLLTYAAGKFINAATGQVVTSGDNSIFSVAWIRGWAEPTPSYVIVDLITEYQGNYVHLFTEDITLQSNRGIELYPAYSGGAVPIPWGTSAEIYTWWSFRGFANPNTWAPR